MNKSNQDIEIAKFISTNYESLGNKSLKHIRKYVAKQMALPTLPKKSFTKYVLYHLGKNKSFDFACVQNSS